MKLRKITARTAMAGTAALAVIGVTATSASAGTDIGIRGERGGAYWYSAGDILRVSDYAKDGLGVEGILVIEGYDDRTLRVTSGANTYRELNLNLKEGTEVHLRMCYFDKTGYAVKCGDGHFGSA